MSDTIVGNLIRRVLKLVREEYRSCFNQSGSGIQDSASHPEESKLVKIQFTLLNLSQANKTGTKLNLTKVIVSKYARILLFQFVISKYVFGFRNSDGFIFVVIFEIVIRRYDQI